MALYPAPQTDPGRVRGTALLAAALRERMARRGWTFRESASSITAHRPDWPAQLCVLVREAEQATPAMLGLAIELSNMPLRGERFRDIFNIDREEILRTYGNFRLLQQCGDGAWLNPVGHRSFMQGMVDGISRATHLAVLDRLGDAAPGLATTFATDANRFIETASPIASLLQRLYQRTVLSAAVAGADLPDVVRPSLAISRLITDSDSPYPWRR